jgi:uncharacterized protein YciI
MKKSIIFFVGIILCLSISGQKATPVYDSILARNLGADEYGMKSYILVILKAGTNNMEKGAARDSIFRGHLKNIGRLAESGKLVIAGPMGDNDKAYMGIFILNVKTISEAKVLLQTDPAVSSGVLDTELYEWYGSAAISEYLKVHDRIVKKQP